jgi:branched-chain amino acid transport system ATP-binding protein
MTTRLQCRKLTVKIGGLTVLDGVDRDVVDGERVALIGPNGSGKSTFFNVLTGSVAPTSGQVLFDGADITGMSPDNIRRKGIARTFQVPRIFKRLSVVDNIAPAVGETDDDRLDTLLTRSQLISRRHDLAGDLTLAELRRLEIVRALAVPPRLLLLDEPTAGLNGGEAEDVIELVTTLTPHDTALIIIEHRLSVLDQLVTRAVVLNHGTCLADGPLAAVRNDAAVRQAYLGRAA